MLLDQGRANPNIRVLQVDESWPEGDRLNPPYPLLLAAGNGISSEIVRVLLSRGADINVVNCLGQNAEDHARWALDTLEAWDELPHDEELDAWDQQFRLSGEVEKMIDVLVDVRRAGSWRRGAVSKERARPWLSPFVAVLLGGRWVLLGLCLSSLGFARHCRLRVLFLPFCTHLRFLGYFASRRHLVGSLRVPPRAGCRGGCS